MFHFVILLFVYTHGYVTYQSVGISLTFDEPDFMEIAGYIASVLIGISLGLIGGGGSILTVPLLVYIFHLQPALATSYSLFIVGTTSLTGAVINYTKGLVRVKTALLFGTSSIITVFITRKFIIQQIPEHLFFIGRVEVTFSLLIMVLFAVLMLFASVSMIRNSRADNIAITVKPKNTSVHRLVGYGISVGFVTGFFGAGGGFVLIPTLVLLMGLTMSEAVGTSLMIISMNSLLGFTGDIGHFYMDWRLMLTITACAIAGILFGIMIGKKINGNNLKKAFGWFVLAMGIYILIREIYL